MFLHEIIKFTKDTFTFGNSSSPLNPEKINILSILFIEVYNMLKMRGLYLPFHYFYFLIPDRLNHPAPEFFLVSTQNTKGKFNSFTAATNEKALP